MSEPGANVIPFGKHKGRLVEELLFDDPSYLQWLTGQDWFRAKFTLCVVLFVGEYTGKGASRSNSSRRWRLRTFA
jgi:uncharacterized protein (DUF3820 family)